MQTVNRFQVETCILYDSQEVFPTQRANITWKSRRLFHAWWIIMIIIVIINGQMLQYLRLSFIYSYSFIEYFAGVSAPFCVSIREWKGCQRILRNELWSCTKTNSLWKFQTAQFLIQLIDAHLKYKVIMQKTCNAQTHTHAIARILLYKQTTIDGGHGTLRERNFVSASIEAISILLLLINIPHDTCEVHKQLLKVCKLIFKWKANIETDTYTNTRMGGGEMGWGKIGWMIKVCVHVFIWFCDYIAYTRANS